MKLITSLFLAILALSMQVWAQNPRILSPGGTAFETYRAGSSNDLVWDTTTTTLGQRFKFQFGTTPSGPWADLPGATNVLDSNASSSNRRGRFNGGFRAPSVPTLTGYVRMVLLSDTTRFGVSTNPIVIERPTPTRVDSVITGTITNNVFLSNQKIYGLKGFVHVVSPAVLTIQAGTILVGDTVGVNSALIINRGAKIIANGTSTLPIVMTSSAPPGERRAGDWGGLLMYGKARINNPGGEAAQEGGVADPNDKTKWYYGGTDDNDNSGSLQYVRVEFAGISIQPNQELNSITMGGVGRGTTMRYIQVSYANDDAYEWFGGNVDGKYLISVGALDDDFDTDNGFSGRIQYGIVQRYTTRADQSTSQAFEADNDATATFNSPLSSAIFSNITAIGPLADTSFTPNSRFGAGAQIRRNSRLSIYNSAFLGWPRGIEIAQTPTMNAANVDSLHIRYCAWYGIKGSWLNLAGGTPPQGMDANWITKGPYNNLLEKGSPAAAKLENPFSDVTFNPALQANSPLLTGANFTRNGVIAIDDSFFDKVDFRGAMGTTRWDLPWANYNPINTEYKAQEPPKPRITSPGGTAGETYRAGTSYDIRWDTTTTKLGAMYKFQFSQSKNGPWTDLAGATSVKDSNVSSTFRRGQFVGGFRAPGIETATGFLRMVEIADTTMNGVSTNPIVIQRPLPTRVDSVLSGSITSNVTLSNTKIYGLRGFVHVVEPAVLTIQPGTIIVGDTVGKNSAMIINRGAKLIANGTPQLPIVFTSSAPPGQRRAGDWGGLLIYGKARINNPGGEAAQEGGVADQNDKTKWYYGGTDDNDNSGSLKYVRVEFGGIALQPNQELNGITMGGVGRGTTFERIQVSYANDDAFEWFGGSMDGKYLISTAALDDDFDTDNGFSGRIQFGIVQRFKTRADVSTSQAFEADNDATATYNAPLSSSIFSNITAIGPVNDTSITPNSRFGAGAQIRRNSRLAIYNSVFVGWPRGIEIAQVPTMNAANVDSVHVRNTAWYGVKGTWMNLAGGTAPAGMDVNWISKAPYSNSVERGNIAAAMIENAFSEDATFNPALKTGSPLLTGATFTKNGVVSIDDAFFTKVDYRGAMNTERWDLPWANYDPINTTYKAQEPVKPRITTPGGATGETYRAGISYDLKWDTTTTTLGVNYKFQYGTSKTGPWTDLAGATNVKDSNVSSTVRRGQFTGGFRAPSIETSTFYLRMVNLADTNLAGVSTNPISIERPLPTSVDSVLSGTITSNVFLSNTKIYGLRGFVHVVSPATLTIQPGTVIVGDTVGKNSALIINRGGKINASGTPQLPIVFTSSAPAGQRRSGDWGGLLMFGRAKINNPGFEAAQEGGVADPNDKSKWYYGGTFEDDNSGVLRYVRVEFGGIALQPNQELNGLTLGGVGKGTTIENVQVSYANDDGIEWFGGNVNAKRLIVVNSLDDDFDTDNGFSGKIQFAVSQRFKARADQSTSQAFESDNDATATYNLPNTTAIFSNVTAIGPLSDVTATPNSRFGAAAQIRRNSRQSIYNSVFMGWPRGLEIAQVPTMNAAFSDSLQIRNSMWFGVKNTWMNTAGGTAPSGFDANWIAKTEFGNSLDKDNANGAMLENPYAEDATFNALPKAGSPVLTGASFTKNGPVSIDDSYFEKVSFKGAFGTERWDLPWANYDPVNTNYKAQTPKAPLTILTPGGKTGETYRAGWSYDINWDTTASPIGSRYKFQFGTSATGPWADLAGATNVIDSTTGSFRRGQYRGGFRAPAVPTTSGYVRMVLLSDTTTTAITTNPFTIERPSASKVDSVLTGTISTNLKLSNTKIYGLRGYVHVVEPAILTIEPGTIILGDSVGNNSALIINRGARLIANGTPTLPIVMTSSAPPGQRRAGDWGGLFLFGKARINNPGGEAAQEGGVANANDKTKWYYGGTDDNDNSGSLEYVRVEFGGIALQPNQELNGITLGGVGRGTKFQRIQVSYSNDDAFEWFGGSVDGKYLIATGTLDDDFDTDNGFSGRIQFGIAQRFKNRADQSTSQAFEADNDATATYNAPLSSSIFSNVTAIGPLADTANSPNSRFGAAVQIRRNSRQSIFNSVFVGWPRGIEIAQVPTMNAALADSLQVRNNSWYGVKGTGLNLAGGTPPAGIDPTWIAKPEFGNVLDRSTPNIAMLENAFAEDITFNPAPKAGSPLLGSASFTRNGVVAIDDAYFEKVSYRGAMGLQRWDLPWANYDPINTDYKAQNPSSVEEGSVKGGMAVEVTPNPATDRIRVRYEVKQTSQVSIRLYNASGTLSSDFIGGQRQEPGIYEFVIDTQDLASGMYFMQIITDQGVRTETISVIR